MYSVHCTLYSEQCTVYSLQCTVYSVKSTVYSVQCTVSSEHLALLLECAGVSKGQGTVDRSLLGKWRGNGLVRQGSLVGEVEMAVTVLPMALAILTGGH